MTKANSAKNLKPQPRLAALYKKRIKRRGKTPPLNHQKKMGPKDR